MKTQHQSQSVLKFIKKTLGEGISENGQIFYSSPGSLFKARYMLIGFNPGGTPSEAECTIRENLLDWKNITENKYSYDAWHKDRCGGKDRYSVLQERVNYWLFEKLLGVCPQTDFDDVFISNLWFLRSRGIASLKSNPAMKEAGLEVWRLFLQVSPARTLIFNGLDSYNQFVDKLGFQVGAKKIIPVERYKKINLKMVLSVAKRDGKKYKLVALPHLSHFKVEGDKTAEPALRRFIV
jgi:hypothetical protein